MPHHRIEFLLCPLSLSAIPDNRDLLRFAAVGPALQRKNHVPRAFKVADVLFPTDTATAVLEPNELLLHFLAAVRTDFIALPHDLFT